MGNLLRGSILVLAILLPTIVTLAYFVWLARQPPWMQQGAYLVGKIVQFALPAVCAFWLLPRVLDWKWPDGYALAQGLGFGLLVGALMLAAYYLVLKPAGMFDGPDVAIQEKIRSMGLNAAWKFVALTIFYAMLHSLLEEYYWRWFVFYELRQVTPLAVAILISSVGFMAHHVIVLHAYFGWSWLTGLCCLGIVVGGAVWAWQYHSSGSLVGPWLGHLVIDAAIFAIGYDMARETFPA
ncbi:CPBP family intramembrane glutamic endopeptidase [Lignipirellula cremea]|uniref:CAAX amino terminal protease self-immunity n=1 Tax=Lignipirellula cremea TaxID=2528010 RepID=A0A518E197_9BACT|nr:CPBP family intramembrane glutamic endopeptidase [Lignipirellula cremea]QDU97841.1 CAAX amino terminal protease self- immunity [Lignipirellula cremea]